MKKAYGEEAAIKQKNNRRIALLALLIHVISSVVLCFLLKEIRFLTSFPSNTNLIHYDAIWYHRIVEDGYYYLEDSMNTMAFFPLFPYSWKALGLNAVGIGIFNGIIWLIGMYLIIRHLNLNLLKSLLVLSTPSLFFCYLPYSESFFFIGSTLLLIGLDKKNFALTLSGTLIACLTRSVGIVFLASFLFVLVSHWKKYNWETNKRQLMHSSWYCISIIMCTVLVIFYQYIETGEWFVFFKVQKSWNRTFNIPKLPFTTASGIKILWLDGLALLISIASFIFCASSLILLFFRGRADSNSEATNFSLAYLVIMGLLGSFFSGVWEPGTGTSLMSLNRYIFAVPFLIFFLNKVCLTSVSSFKWKEWVLVLSIIIFAWSLLGAFGKLNGHTYYFQTVLYFSCMTLYVILYYSTKFTPKLYILLYVVNLFFQMYLFCRYLSNQWVG